jgi:hypothetical protein
MLFPSVTGCWEYVVEGRPYALALACAGVAAVCWQSIVMNKWRTLSLLGVSLSLVFALNFHYYSILLFPPFVIAEGVRAYTRRKIDIAVWVALLAPLLALLPYLSLVRASTAHFATWNYLVKPRWFGSLANFGNQFLAPSLTMLLGIACIYLVFSILVRPGDAELGARSVSRRMEFLPEIVLVLTFVWLPVAAIALSKLVTHVLYSRYLIASMFGIAALTALVLWFACSGRKEPGLAAALLLGIGFAHTAGADLKTVNYRGTTSIREALQRRVPPAALDDSLPIVVAHPDEFMTLIYYGDPALVERLVYVSSEELSAQRQGFTFLDRIMVASAPFLATRVIDYHAFIAKYPKFYVQGGLGGQEWIIAQLLLDKAQMRLLQGGPVDAEGDQAEPCFLVQMPAPRS